MQTKWENNQTIFFGNAVEIRSQLHICIRNIMFIIVYDMLTAHRVKMGDMPWSNGFQWGFSLKAAE